MNKGGNLVKIMVKLNIEEFVCFCGKEVKRKKKHETENKFCSRKCFAKYSWYGKHGWLYNRKDFKTEYATRNFKYITLEKNETRR